MVIGHFIRMIEAGEWVMRLMDLVTILTIKGLALMRLIPLSVISPLVGSDSDGVCLRVNLLNVVRILLLKDFRKIYLKPMESVPSHL